MEGWISLQRKMQSHWLWDEKRVFSRAEAWIDLLLSVNHKPNKIVIKGVIINVERGSTCMSLKTLSVKWGWSTKKVSRFLELLKSDQMIDYESKRVTTYITVCNYESYQSLGNAKETQKKRRGNAKETQRKTNNNDNNDNNENNDNNIGLHLFSNSPYFDIQEFKAKFEGTDYEAADLDYYYEALRSWSESKGAKKKDWIATARGFMLRDRKENKLITKKDNNGLSQTTIDILNW